MVPGTLVLAMAVALTACAQAPSSSGGDEPPRRPDPVILELRSSEQAPIGVLSYGDVDQPGELGTRCWAMMCVDLIGPPTPKTFTEVPGDAVIELTGDGEAESITVGHPPNEEYGPPVDERELTVKNGRALLDLEPGRYVLVVFASWTEGDAVLTFGLQVS